MSDQASIETPASRPRRGRRLLALIALIAVLGVAALLVLGVAPSVWTLRAALAGSPDAAAWRHVPADEPVLVVCDVPDLLASSLAKELRPQLDDLAARHGFDARLAEGNVRQLIVTADGPEFGFAVASGFRLSPLMLPRFAKPWTVVPFGDDARAASDGATMLVPLEPGIVAWVPQGVEPARVAASLEAARANPATPLPLAGSSLRAMILLDDRLRAAARHELPSEASRFVESLVRLDASLDASDSLDLAIDLTHRDAPSAQATVALLTQANTAAVLLRGAGSLAALLGPDAALLGLLPPLTITQDGAKVHVEAKASADLISKWLVEAERRLTQP